MSAEIGGSLSKSGPHCTLCCCMLIFKFLQILHQFKLRYHEVNLTLSVRSIYARMFFFRGQKVTRATKDPKVIRVQRWVTLPLPLSQSLHTFFMNDYALLYWTLKENRISLHQRFVWRVKTKWFMDKAATYLIHMSSVLQAIYKPHKTEAAYIWNKSWLCVEINVIFLEPCSSKCVVPVEVKRSLQRSSTDILGKSTSSSSNYPTWREFRILPSQ